MKAVCRKFTGIILSFLNMVVWGTSATVPLSYATDGLDPTPPEVIQEAPAAQPEIQGRGILQVAPSLGGLPKKIFTSADGTWRHAHGDAANTGLAKVVTAPGTLPIRKITGIGNFAPGAGPVIAPDGTIYLGNIQGQLWAFTPTGDLKWMRDTPGRKIIASPVIGSDGSIYVVGTLMVRDHRQGKETLRYFTNLYRFDPGGAMVWVRPFPEHTQGAGTTSAAPNIWRSAGNEVIIIPVFYHQMALQLSLAAFSTNGNLLFDHKITTWAAQTTGSASWGEAFCAIYPLCFNQQFGLTRTEPALGLNQLPKNVEPPMPSVGIFSGSSNSAPLVIVADNYQNMVGYRFSPTQGFQELFRNHLSKDWIRMSSPALLDDGHSVIRANSPKKSWFLFGGPNTIPWKEVSTPFTGGTPTFTIDGRIVLLDRSRGVTVIGTSPSPSVLNHVVLEGESIAPAAASCSHVFVSTANALVTLNANATGVVTKFDWRSGGLSSPAIAPNGGVYALAEDSLHIFPPPSSSPLAGPAGCQGAASRVQGETLTNPIMQSPSNLKALPNTRVLPKIFRRGIEHEQPQENKPEGVNFGNEQSESNP